MEKRNTFKLIFGIVLILISLNFVDADDINWAASANGGVPNIFMTDAFGGSGVCCGYYDNSAQTSCTMPCPSPTYAYPTIIIDENDNTYEGFYMNSGGAGRIFNLHSQVTFNNPKNLTRINYTIYTDGSADSTSGQCSGHAEQVYVHYAGTPSGTWDSIDYFGPLTGTHTRTIAGDFRNVDKIYLKLCFNTGGAPDAKVYEIKAIGPEPITPTCSDGIQNQGETGIDCGGSCPACAQSHSCSNANQTILKLYSSTNSHGALWDDVSGYNYDICYNEIFGIAYVGANPHDCTATNKILGLSNINNAHAEIPSLDAYSTDVCYGNLVCSAKTTCASDEKTIVRLYNETNSHISNASDSNYPIKICCKEGTERYWANINGQLITSAQIGDTVLMIGSANDFVIKESDGILGYDDIRTVTDTFTLNGKTAAKWTITQEDFDKGNPASDLGLEFLTDNQEEFIFADGASGELLVNKTSYNNALPHTSITNPLTESNYTIDANTGKTKLIDFTQISSDEDDDLQVQWLYGDGTDSSWLINCLTTGICNTQHEYNSSGTKIIKITAKEMNRSQSAQDSSWVYIYKTGINVFAIIDSPEYGQPVIGRIVNINANRSFAAQCGASCPAGCGAIICYNVIDPLGAPPLSCCKKAVVGNNNLTFEWTFDGIKDLTETRAEFTKFFSTPGEHTINLEVTYNE
ncbi:MAG: hypothetical protein AABW67_01345 [Nanoarchaeota archaeon]